MNLSYALLIPWRDNRDGIRSRLWSYCQQRLDLSGIPYYVADDGLEHGQPFNIGAARNRAFAQSTEDVVLVMDADHVVQPLVIQETLSRIASQDLPWTPIFGSNGVFSFWQTEAILRGATDPLTAKPELTAPYCTSPIAVRREVWEDMGGQPETYSGWGAEDVQTRCVLQALHPIPLEANPSADTLNLCLFHQWAKLKDPWGIECWDANLSTLHQFEDVLAEGPEAVRCYIDRQKSLRRSSQ